MKKLVEITFLCLLAAVLTLTGSVRLEGQTPPGTRPPAPPREPKDRTEAHARAGSTAAREASSERSVKTDPNVSVWIPCISRGSVRLTGWNRNEVRVFIDNGNDLNFTIQEKSPRTGDPVWIKVSGVQPPKGRYGPASECIWGEDVEIDVPIGASVNIKGHDIITRIDSVRKAEIRVVGGNISIRNITNGVGAYAGQGDISVEASDGSINLESTTGNILVFESAPSEIGDIFKAKTNSGSITLQGVSHRQVEVNSISGSVLFSGPIRNGGSYHLRTSRGSIRMAIPVDASSRISATYGFGAFRSEIPIEITTENVSPGPVRSIVGTFGKGGDSMIRLASTNGTIAVTKLDP